MKVSTLGIDLAKNVFQLHGVDHEGHTILRKKLTRAKFCSVCDSTGTLSDWHGSLLIQSLFCAIIHPLWS
ncbi:putative transposase, IS110 family [Escherichia coli]|uniref:Putative transposase, IS110 family n=1 Tax=Escherichia coli TaxID=562 RepID=A0A376LJF6_ECOLX|nr:putative transposase, IS110 family [Escherichia coli]